MGVKVAATATTFLQWSAQPIVPRSPSSSQTLVSTAISSTSSRRRSTINDGRYLSCRFGLRRLSRSALFGIRSTKLQRSRSCELWESSTTTKTRSIRSAYIARFDSFSDEEFSKKIEDLALRFQVPDDEVEEHMKTTNDPEQEIIHNSNDGQSVNIVESYSYGVIDGVDKTKLGLDSVEPPWHEMVHSSSIERKANSVDLPLSLRIIKKKLQWEEGVRQASESAYCSVKKAFSSMVFMIRELHSFTLQLRELLFYEDLQGILQRVQKEMQASFVWLFQQVFSHTPTLMVYVMILLANFTVYSIGSNGAIAASLPSSTTISYSARAERTIVDDRRNNESMKLDPSLIKTFSVSSSNGKTASIDGNNGGGGKVPPVASGTDSDGWFDESDRMRTIVPDGASELSSHIGSTMLEAEPSVSGRASRAEEIILWNSIVEESDRMKASTRDEALDHETMQRFVSPVEANIEPDDYADYFKTELLYQAGVSQEPNNVLLLVNYAQFLYLVAHDYDRAEEYFKRAIEMEAGDAEALSKYATFLWRARKDDWRAEEMFLEAISADPTNSYHAANYAHFLWNTGAEDTCFPLGPNA